MAGEIIGGLHAVTEALQRPGAVNRVYCAKESRAKGVAELATLARQHKIPVDYVPQAKLNELTGSRDHQGVAAALSPIEYTALNACIELCPSNATVLLLDQVQHPQNLGMILRSAAAAGTSGVVVPSRRGALLDASVIRASAGAAFRVPVVTESNLSQTIRRLKDEKFWIYGLDGNAKTSLYDVSWPARVAIIAGNESEGIRPGLRKECDDLLKIPLANGVESLNVAVAVSVALFHINQARSRS